MALFMSSYIFALPSLEPSGPYEAPVWGDGKEAGWGGCVGGVGDWRFHDIRRGIATHLEDNGVDRFYVERVLTHKDRSVTGIYARSNHLDVRRTILDRWALVLTAPEGLDADNVISFTGPVT